MALLHSNRTPPSWYAQIRETVGDDPGLAMVSLTMMLAGMANRHERMFREDADLIETLHGIVVQSWEDRILELEKEVKRLKEKAQ